VTFSGVSHTTTNGDGTLHHIATVHGTEGFDPTDPGLPSYTDRFTARDGQNGALGQTITSTATFHDTLTGSDGSKIQDRGVFHITTPSGRQRELQFRPVHTYLPINGAPGAAAEERTTP
jgi:hypothetical protein